jgi:hypothetical protein
MGDFSIKSSVPSSEMNQIQNPLNQLADTLRMPGTETERFGRLKEMFQNLSQNDAQDLFNQLQANKDPIAKEFNSAFEIGKNDLLPILQSKFATASDAKPQVPIQQQSAHADAPAKDTAKKCN